MPDPIPAPRAAPRTAPRAATWVAAAPVVFLLLWSGGYTVAKVGIGDADPFTLLSLRYAGVLLLLAPFALVLRPPPPTGRAQWAHLAFVGFLIQVVYFGAAWTAFRLGSSAGAVALVTSLQPVLVGLAMPLVSDERVSRARWAGLALGLAGTVLVLSANAGIQVTGGAGLAFAVAALLAFTLATVWEKRFGVAHHPLTANAVHYAVGLACTLCVAVLFEPMRVAWTGALLGSLAYLVVGNSIVAIGLLLMMIRRGEATRVSALFFLVPPTSALIAWLAIDEPMAPLAWVGMGVAALGVWLATRRQGR